jgi:molecular chaperone GrpE (heat shock protein)
MINDQPSPADYTPHLQQWMQQVGFSSFRALSQAAGVSEKQIRQLRRGEIAQMRMATVLKLSQALGLSPLELLEVVGKGEGKREKAEGRGGERESGRAGDGRMREEKKGEGKREKAEGEMGGSSGLEELQREYDRLQAQLTQQRQVLWQEFQQTSVQILESLLLQLPTAAYAAQQNPQVPAVKLLPLLRPLEQLLQEWGIEAIAPVGSEVAYDPQWHQLMEGTATVGDLVKIRYTGYRQGETLLYRAKVSPVGGMGG